MCNKVKYDSFSKPRKEALYTILHLLWDGPVNQNVLEMYNSWKYVQRGEHRSFISSL